MSTADRGGSPSGQGDAFESRVARIIDFDLARCRRIISDLHYRLTRFSNSDRFYEEYELALYEYFEGRGVYGEDEDDLYDNFQSEEEFSRFLSWYSLYFVTDEYDKTFPELYLDRRRNQLSALEREILQSYSRSVLSVYEVQRIDPGQGVEIRDIFADRAFSLADPAAAQTLCKWDLFYGGLIEVRGYQILGGMPITVIPQKLRRFIEVNLLEIYNEERENYRNFRDYLKRATAEICALVENAVRNLERPETAADPEAEKASLTSLLYRVDDYDAFLQIIDRSPVFAAAEPRKPGAALPAKVLRFHWLPREGAVGPSRGAPGTLFLKRDSLLAQCASAQRAETLRSILDRMFGKAITYRTTVHKNVDRQADPAAPDRAPSSPEGVFAGRETPERPFDNWIDEKISAIGNITPREAVKTPEGKRRLIDLLKEFENQNERALRRGLKGQDTVFFPVEQIRKELGL
ncbi:MAG: hypothetical protein HPY67_14400 [Syntrophaceae bacterium]|nr:hypothetical protein [Syntrophaceae bacterium]